MSKLEIELREWYSKYKEEGESTIVDNMDYIDYSIWKPIYLENKDNPDNSLYYSLFLIGIEEIGDYPQVESILSRIKTDVRCAIVRCCADSYFFRNDKIIEEYDFKMLLNQATSRQEIALLYYLKAMSTPQQKFEYLQKSIEAYKYCFISLMEIMEYKENSSLFNYYKELYVNCERFILRLHHQYEKFDRYLFYKPYVYKEMNLLNLHWTSLIESRKRLGFKKGDLPALDLDSYDNIDIDINYCIPYSLMKYKGKIY